MYLVQEKCKNNTGKFNKVLFNLQKELLFILLELIIFQNTICGQKYHSHLRSINKFLGIVRI